LTRRALPVLGAALLLLGAAAPAASQAGGPLSLTVGTPAQMWQPTVRVQGVFDDPALGDALERGFPLRLLLRVELWERRLFDRLEGAVELAVALTLDPLENRYVLRTADREQRFTSLSEVEPAIRPLLAVPLRPGAGGRYYYIASLRIETLSLSDLDELRNWLRGEAAPVVDGTGNPARALSRGVRRLFVRMVGLPTRRYEVRSSTFET
jgi:hypothetical protein